jgi:hypothetical protein
VGGAAYIANTVSGMSLSWMIRSEFAPAQIAPETSSGVPLDCMRRSTRDLNGDRENGTNHIRGEPGLLFRSASVQLQYEAAIIGPLRS